MNEIDKTNLTDQTKFRLNEITKIENYFNSKINQRKSCIKKLSKYLTTFDCISKVLYVLIAMSGGVSFISFTSIAGAPVGIVGIFNHRNNKMLLSTTSNKKGKTLKTSNIG